MIRKCQDEDFEDIYEIINDAAQAYRGIIPPDCWHEPYMSREQLRRDIEQGVDFWGWHQAQTGELGGVMGRQDKGQVSLIRHAYVRTAQRRLGIGSGLLQHLEGMMGKPILIGTWADALWAISFYQKNGYGKVTPREKDRLLKKYWSISPRQIETSVVLIKNGDSDIMNP